MQLDQTAIPEIKSALNMCEKRLMMQKGCTALLLL